METLDVSWHFSGCNLCRLVLVPWKSSHLGPWVPTHWSLIWTARWCIALYFPPFRELGIKTSNACNNQDPVYTLWLTLLVWFVTSGMMPIGLPWRPDVAVISIRVGIASLVPLPLHYSSWDERGWNIREMDWAWPHFLHESWSLTVLHWAEISEQKLPLFSKWTPSELSWAHISECLVKVKPSLLWISLLTDPQSWWDLTCLNSLIFASPGNLIYLFVASGYAVQPLNVTRLPSAAISWLLSAFSADDALLLFAYDAASISVVRAVNERFRSWSKTSLFSSGSKCCLSMISIGLGRVSSPAFSLHRSSLL